MTFTAEQMDQAYDANPIPTEENLKAAQQAECTASLLTSFLIRHPEADADALMYAVWTALTMGVTIGMSIAETRELERMATL